MSQSDVACLTDPTSELLGDVIVIHSPTSDRTIGIRIPAAAFAYGRLGRCGLANLLNHLLVLSQTLVADGVSLQCVSPPLVLMKLGDGFVLHALVADAVRHGIAVVIVPDEQWLFTVKR